MAPPRAAAALCRIRRFFWREAQSAANTLALQRLHTLQLELAAALQGPLLERDIPTLREIAEALVQNGEIAYLAIFDGADERLVLVGASAETVRQPRFGRRECC